MKSLLETCEPTVSTALAVPGTEVTQMIVDTMAKTFQKSLQAIVNPDEARCTHNAYQNPTTSGSIKNWVVVMRRYLEPHKTPTTPQDKARMILENLDGEPGTII